MTMMTPKLRSYTQESVKSVITTRWVIIVSFVLMEAMETQRMGKMGANLAIVMTMEMLLREYATRKVDLASVMKIPKALVANIVKMAFLEIPKMAKAVIESAKPSN